MNGIIGFIILIILFNVLNRVLRGLARRTGEAPSTRRPAREPMIEAEPEEASSVEQSGGFDSPPAATETHRTVESWLEEILAGSGTPETPRREPSYDEDDEARIREDMRRYDDFERARAETTRDAPRRSAFFGRVDRTREHDRAASPLSSAAVPAASFDQRLSILSSPERLRDAVVASEILGPCRARANWRKHASRLG